jgi:diguanylate cyclase (GGDEF)-like protein
MFVARFWGLLLTVVLAVLALAPASARAAIPLEPCVATAKAPGLADPYGHKAIRFVCEEAQHRHGAGDFAVDFQFAPIAAAPDDPLVLRITSVWQDAGRFRFRYADGTSAELAFRQEDASRYLQIGAIFEIPVPRREAALTGITLQTTGTANLRGVVLGAALMPRSQSHGLTDWLVALYAGFLGLVLALIVYNLSLWAALRHRFQLHYCYMVTAITGYVFTSSGAVMLLFPALANNDRLRFNYILLTLSAVTAMRFVRAFFEERVLPGWLRRTLDVVCTFALVSAIAFAVLAPIEIWVLDRFYFGSLSLVLLLVFAVLFYARRNRSRYFWMFTIAWIAPIMTSVARSLHGFGLIPYSFWLDNGNLIALAIEALLSSILITVRLRELSRERDTALEGEQSALRLAGSDPLTGLLNRRAFLEKAIGREGGFRLMLLDIDHFKAINDRIGHEAGDQVLRAVAGVIQSSRPKGSLAVRLGGEEFGLLIPLSRHSDCTPDTLVAAVRAKAMPLGQVVTVSLGFADGTVGSEEDWKRLYRLADAALYRAKADGRDRACRATDFKLVAAARGS